MLLYSEDEISLEDNTAPMKVATITVLQAKYVLQ